MSDTKITVDTIAGLQAENILLSEEKTELKIKLEKIRQIIKDYDTNCGLEEYMYLEQIKEILDQE